MIARTVKREVIFFYNKYVLNIVIPIGHCLTSKVTFRESVTPLSSLDITLVVTNN